MAPLGITALSAAKKTLDHYRQKVRAGDEMKNRPWGNGAVQVRGTRGYNMKPLFRGALRAGRYRFGANRA